MCQRLAQRFAPAVQTGLYDTGVNARDLGDFFQRQFLKREQNNRLSLQNGELGYRFCDLRRSFRGHYVAQNIDTRRGIRRLFGFTLGDSEVPQCQVSDNPKEVGS
jgi:hypothetical protein